MPFQSRYHIRDSRVVYTSGFLAVASSALLLRRVVSAQCKVYISAIIALKACWISLGCFLNEDLASYGVSTAPVDGD